MDKQDNLRQQARLVKAIDSEFNYIAQAELIGINTQSFYNWLSGAYTLGADKVRILSSWYSDILD